MWPVLGRRCTWHLERQLWLNLVGEIKESFPERAMTGNSTGNGREEGEDMCSRGLEKGQCNWRGTASLRGAGSAREGGK